MGVSVNGRLHTGARQDFVRVWRRKEDIACAHGMVRPLVKDIGLHLYNHFGTHKSLSLTLSIGIEEASG